MNNKYYKKYKKYKNKYIEAKKKLNGGKKIQKKGIHIGMKIIKEKDFPYRNIVANIPIDIKKMEIKKNSDKAVAPSGLWYGFKHYWKERLNCNNCLWDTVVKEDNPDKVYEFEDDDHLYEVVLKDDIKVDIQNNTTKFHPDKLLSIETWEDFIEFTEKYSNIKGDNILWGKVSRHYGGIEIKEEPFNKFFVEDVKAGIYDDKSIGYGWLGAWHVPSGNIWNMDIIKDIKKVL